MRSVKKHNNKVYHLATAAFVMSGCITCCTSKGAQPTAHCYNLHSIQAGVVFEIVIERIAWRAIQVYQQLDISKDLGQLGRLLLCHVLRWTRMLLQPQVEDVCKFLKCCRQCLWT